MFKNRMILGSIPQIQEVGRKIVVGPTPMVKGVDWAVANTPKKVAAFNYATFSTTDNRVIFYDSNNQNLLYSSDGISFKESKNPKDGGNLWNSAHTPVPIKFFMNKNFIVMVTSSPGQSVYYSTDGINWTEFRYMSSYTRGDCYGVNEGFYLTHDEFTNPQSRQQYYSDIYTTDFKTLQVFKYGESYGTPSYRVSEGICYVTDDLNLIVDRKKVKEYTYYETDAASAGKNLYYFYNSTFQESFGSSNALDNSRHFGLFKDYYYISGYHLFKRLKKGNIVQALSSVGIPNLSSYYNSATPSFRFMGNNMYIPEINTYTTDGVNWRDFRYSTQGLSSVQLLDITYIGSYYYALVSNGSKKMVYYSPTGDGGWVYAFDADYISSSLKDSKGDYYIHTSAGYKRSSDGINWSDLNWKGYGLYANYNKSIMYRIDTDKGLVYSGEGLLV